MLMSWKVDVCQQHTAYEGVVRLSTATGVSMGNGMVRRLGLAKVGDAAEFLNLSRPTIYRLMESGELRSVKISGSRRIPWSELHRIAEGINNEKGDSK